MLYPILYLEINLASVMLIPSIRFKTLGISQMVSQRNFSSAIDAEVVFFLSDTVAVLISCGLIPAGKAGLLVLLRSPAPSHLSGFSFQSSVIYLSHHGIRLILKRCSRTFPSLNVLVHSIAFFCVKFYYVFCIIP